jgi:hypothetical protein
VPMIVPRMQFYAIEISRYDMQHISLLSPPDHVGHKLNLLKNCEKEFVLTLEQESEWPQRLDF